MENFLIDQHRINAFDYALGIYRESPQGININEIDKIFDLAERVYRFFILPEKDQPKIDK